MNMDKYNCITDVSPKGIDTLNLMHSLSHVHRVNLIIPRVTLIIH